MQHTKTFAIVSLFSALTVFGAAHSFARSAMLGSSVPSHSDFVKVAERLQHRIESRYGKTVSLSTLMDAVAYRRSMFARSVTVAFQDQETGEEVSAWNVSLGRYPDWMSFSLDGGALFTLDERAIEHSIVTTPPDGLSIPSFATVTETVQEGSIQRATVNGSVASGQVYDAASVARDVHTAFSSNHDVAVVSVQSVEGAVLYNDGTQTIALHELGLGRSEFHTSPYGRKMNVRKAMNEKANGVVIPAGSTFSFNATLGGPITHGNGWYDSLIIVNGKDLEPAPGGGICQAATTVFRAAVSAGLPITVRKSHSLYVTYYKQYGVGLDATVFPGKQDMKFENDTSGPLILLSRTDDQDNAYATLYGVDDDRTVVMDGPYFGSVYKEPLLGKTLRGNEIGWVQRVTNADGTTREQLLVAQYLQLPRSVATEFEPIMHAAGDLVADAR